MKIAMLISGGVDSSLAAALLKEQGHEVVAFYLKIWLEDDLAWLGDCPWQEDLKYVEALCEQLDIPLKQINLQKEYWEKIVGYTVSQVQKGFTPNPDVLCNMHIKFGCFLEHIDYTFDKVATGHYAQVIEQDGQFVLKCAPDKVKDQTYFLAHLDQSQLARAMFPIGHLTKAQVREQAQVRNLPAKDRHDSQGLCFLGKLKFQDFLKFHLGTLPGDLIELETNKVLGKHQGFWFFTIGQRHGLGLSGGPWYVAKKDIVANQIFISKSYFSSDKLRNVVWVQDFHWFKKPANFDLLSVKLRHGPEVYDCQMSVENGIGRIQLPCNDQGIAPGQFAVFYQQDLCLGCAVISLPGF